MTRLITPFCKECITKLLAAKGYHPVFTVDESESPAHYMANGKKYCTPEEA